jgi:urea transporter
MSIIQSLHKNFLRWFLESILNAYSMVLFSSKKLAGLILITVTFFHVEAGIMGLIGVVFTNLISLFLGVYKERIRKGLFGFNGLLVGLSITLYHTIDLSLILLLFVACILLVFVILGIESFMGYYLGLPVLSLPFVISTFIIYMSFFNYNGLTLRTTNDFLNPEYLNFIPIPILYYFKALASIFFQTNALAGFIVGLVLLAISRISFLLSIIGYTFGSIFHILLGGNHLDITSGVVGFNYILSSIAIGGIFLKPSIHSLYLSIIAAVLSALVASFTKVFFYFFNFPVLSFPFTVVTLLLLYVSKNLGNLNFRVMDYINGSPEENLDYYNTRQKRFGVSGLYVRLPFLGDWIVSQGYDGKFTHKDQWNKSLDFMAIDLDGKIRKGISNNPDDYYTFGLPVLATAAGRIVKVVAHMEDNEISEIKTEHGENWGNFIIIEHSPYLYSQLSHLKKDSILVKEGDYVNIGARLGSAGNSGRSPEPHIHLHFQRTPELGSPTIEVTFTQFIQKNDQIKFDIKYNSIPNEGSIISNLQPDINIKNFFTLAPGNKYPIIAKEKKGKVVTEIWESKVDFLGHRFIEDENGNLLYFFIGADFYASLDFLGNSNSMLYAFYLATYRIPYLPSQCEWNEPISYKHSSDFFEKLIKDIIAPFSDRVSLKWKGEFNQSGEILTILSKSDTKIIYQTKMNFQSTFPGTLQLKNSKEEWLLHRLDQGNEK